MAAYRYCINLRIKLFKENMMITIKHILNSLLVAIFLSTSVAMAQIVSPPYPVLTKSYTISPTGSYRFATFTSEASCGFGCTITHRISSDPVDRLVVVKWLDASGASLMEPVSNAYWRNFLTLKTLVVTSVHQSGIGEELPI